ncbi:MAG: hypothetical protein ACREA9_29030 [Pyrinomonadaceae bacterium]
MADRPSVSQLLSKARQFTDIEDRTLDAWLTAENLDLDDLAARILDAGLMAEHFNSLLDADTQKRSAEELQALLDLHATFEKTLNELTEMQETQPEKKKA